MNEPLDDAKRRKKKCIVFKVDYEKVYDYVSWKTRVGCEKVYDYVV